MRSSSTEWFAPLLALTLLMSASCAEPAAPPPVVPPPVSRGTITGTVRDAGHQPIRATVVITNGPVTWGRGEYVATDGLGGFKITGRGSGIEYILTAVAASYFCADQTVTLGPDAGATVNITCNLAVAQQPGIYVADSAGSSIRWLTTGTHPVWSPDGRRIAFERAGWITVMNRDGTDQRKIRPGREPGWSRDGQRIAFSDGADVMVMNADGSNVSTLVASTFKASFGQPTWAPNSDRIAFLRYDFYEDHYGPYAIPAVWMTEAAGSSPTALGLSCYAGEHDPAWSPDGSRIAFSSLCHGVAALTATSPTGLLELLVRAVGIRRAEDPAWSPDGTRLLVSLSWEFDVAPNPSIYVVSIGGGSPRFLIADGRDPAWSPDGAHIAFVH